MSDELTKYFMAQTNERFNKIDRKLDQLIGFRFMQLGASAAISALFGVVAAVATIYFGRV